MIKLIYGPKGFGKTKIIMDDINAAAKDAKGNIVFITDKPVCSVSINLNVRCVYTDEYGISSVEALKGFIMGLVAGNSDIEGIYVDGILRIADCKLTDLEELFIAIKKVEGVKFELTVSAEKSELPKFMLEYV